MSLNLTTLLGDLANHPEVVAKLFTIVAEDPGFAVALVQQARSGGDWRAFIVAHDKTLLAILAVLVPALQADPALVASVLAALTSQG